MSITQKAEEMQPSLRLCDVARPSDGSCGFHLTRTAWDPYPWVSGVESGSPAETAGLQAGDCVLEVNGEDVLGQRIGEVASRVRARADRVTLLLWNAGADPYTAATCIPGNGTTPGSFQQLSNLLQSVLQLLECPVCFETVPPPAFQCSNGHVTCGRCRSRAEKCPVCRVNFGPRARCLVSDKLYSLLTKTLNQNKQKSVTNKKQLQKHPTLYLKSRIITPCLRETAEEKSNPTPAMSSGSLSTQEYSGISCEQAELLENTSHFVESSDSSQSIADGGNAELRTTSVMVKPKALSEENISECNQQLTTRRINEKISSFSMQGASLSPLKTRSLSAGQIPLRSELPPGKTFYSEGHELSLHCPFPVKSELYCCSILKSSDALLQHLREVHQGPLVQYFLQSPSNRISFSLPLSSSKAMRVSSLTSFTVHGDVFFVEVATGATPGHQLVWLWLLGNAAKAERYRLRLAFPEGDTHTGPVFPLTASWSDVVNSNCCLSIEERRYIRGNPDVQLEILDIGLVESK